MLDNELYTLQLASESNSHLLTLLLLIFYLSYILLAKLCWETYCKRLVYQYNNNIMDACYVRDVNSVTCSDDKPCFQLHAGTGWATKVVRYSCGCDRKCLMGVGVNSQK